jgi:hypothetical protein
MQDLGTGHSRFGMKMDQMDEGKTNSSPNKPCSLFDLFESPPYRPYTNL